MIHTHTQLYWIIDVIINTRHVTQSQTIYMCFIVPKPPDFHSCFSFVCSFVGLTLRSSTILFIIVLFSGWLLLIHSHPTIIVVTCGTSTTTTSPTSTTSSHGGCGRSIMVIPSTGGHCSGGGMTPLL